MASFPRIERLANPAADTVHRTAPVSRDRSSSPPFRRVDVIKLEEGSDPLVGSDGSITRSILVLFRLPSARKKSDQGFAVEWA